MRTAIMDNQRIRLHSQPEGTTVEDTITKAELLQQAHDNHDIMLAWRNSKPYQRSIVMQVVVYDDTGTTTIPVDMAWEYFATNGYWQHEMEEVA